MPFGREMLQYMYVRVEARLSAKQRRGLKRSKMAEDREGQV
jgi:hypothetical protein